MVTGTGSDIEDFYKMIIASFQCPVKGDLIVEKLDLSLLFSDYKNLYIKTFRLSEHAFRRMHKLKIERGGFLIRVSSLKKELTLFSLSAGVDDFFELGDVMKIEKSFPRESFARALRESTEAIIESEKIYGAYAYPNKFAVALEEMAGYKRSLRYVRNVSIIFIGLVVLLPIQVNQGKIIFHKGYFKKNIFKRARRLRETRLSLLGIKIFSKDHKEKKRFSVLNFGFLYEFETTKDYGDFLLVYGNHPFNISNFGFEFCDNSA